MRFVKKHHFSRSLRQLIAQVRSECLSVRLIKKELDRLNQELIA